MNNCCGVKQGLKFAVSHCPWDIRFQFLIQDAKFSIPTGQGIQIHTCTCKLWLCEFSHKSILNQCILFLIILVSLFDTVTYYNS